MHRWMIGRQPLPPSCLDAVAELAYRTVTSLAVHP
jgi:hypothetical protein